MVERARDLIYFYYMLKLAIMKKGVLLILFLTIAAYSAFRITLSYAELIDRVAAFIDEDAITLTELNETYGNTKKLNASITREEVLNTMINRILLLKEAKKMRIESQTEEGLLKEYIDIKVRTFIKLSENDIKEFYENNREKFRGQEFDEARDRIENYLIEQEVNSRLKRHIEDLRLKSYIKINNNIISY